MKRILGAAALLTMAMAACDRNPTQAGSAPGRQAQLPRLTSVSGGGASIGISDTLHANASGRCDYPLSAVSFAGQTGEFGDATIIFTHSNATADTAAVTYSQMADVIWPIPAFGGATGVLTDDNFGDSTPAPYSITWKIEWTIGSGTYTGTLHSVCVS
ncbi:MAG TPA: hypothetical protein VFJ16_05165 [Longimicrobium sp.]|nr:hypothetical protein [Longimicrobium sp.]